MTIIRGVRRLATAALLLAAGVACADSDAGDYAPTPTAHVAVPDLNIVAAVRLGDRLGGSV